MSKSSFYKISKTHMASRIFRRTKSAVSSEMTTNASSLEVMYSGLSQESIEKLSCFLMEANMLRAQIGQESINVEEALRYLRACHFNSTKEALEIFKNYQKHRETYHLDNLRPYREPLCSGIGARKMEIVGTRDSEGHTIVLFTVSRHETFKSDHKADMQLLFYTLNQTSESETAQEKGIVFIIDFRDSQLSDVRYVASVVSVLKDGYPIHTKMIYVVSTKRLSRIIFAFQRMVKFDLNKMKVVDFAELSEYFLPEQLPLSLGGTFIHSPTHQSPHHVGASRHQVGVAKDDISVSLHHTPYPQQIGRSGSDSSKNSREAKHMPHPSSNGGGKSVNKLLEIFESNKESQSSNKPLPPPSPSKLRPVPPSKAKKPKKTPFHSSGEPQEQKQQGSGIHQPLLKKGSDGDLGSKRLPLFPPNGRLNVGKTNSVDSVFSDNTKHAARPIASTSTSKVTEETGRSSNPPTDTSTGANVLAKTQGMLKKIKNFTSSSSSEPLKVKHPDDLSTSCNVQKNMSEVLHRRRADSADKATPSSFYSKTGASSARTSPKRPHMPVHPVPLTGNKKTSSEAASVSKSTTQTQARSKPIGGAYENVNPSKSTQSPPQSKAPCPPLPYSASQPLSSQESYDYDNLSFSNRDSDVYENIGIGFAGTEGNMTGPLPPLPPTRHLVQPAKLAYENVEISRKSPAKKRVSQETIVAVEDDDEMLFGKEGPPGMQETIYENFGPDKGNRLMTIEELAAHVDKLGKKGLSTEYYRVRNEPITGAHKTCRLPCNTSKNRYKDVICYDETRVKLKSSPGKEGSDYIHANYVDAFKRPKAFILTQGPKDKTVMDFWRMVWEKQVYVIVMVTKCVELGKRKCAQYWPESDAGCDKHGQFTVTVTKLQNCEGYDVRTLQLSFKGIERTLMHFQFLAWPDYGIPSSGTSIVCLIIAVRSAQGKLSQAHAGPGPHPVVVHCSAGVGRSGAFCSIDNCIHEIDEQKKVNFQAAVRKMRNQRAFAIQTEEQYEFCYQTLLEYAKR